MEKLKFMTGLVFIGISLMGAVLVLMASLFGVEFGGIAYYFGEHCMSPILFGIYAIVGAYLLENSKFKK